MPTTQEVQNFAISLNPWLEEEGIDEDQTTARAKAVSRIVHAYQKDSTRLNLRGLRITSLPAEIGNLVKLTELGLGDNQLTTLPESIGGLTALTDLYLGGNRLTALPESIGGLNALTNLNLYGNQLTTLPEQIGDLTALTYLNLYGNQLNTLPERIGDLTALTCLHLAGNQLTTLPERIGDLTALKFLNLAGNQLTTIPERIGDLTALTYLNLYGNPLTPSPALLDGLFELEEKRCKVDYPDQISLEVRRNRAESRLQKSRLQQASEALSLASYDPKSPLSKLGPDVMAEVLKFATDTRLLSEEEKKEVRKAAEERVKQTEMYKRYVGANSTANNQELETKSVTASQTEVAKNEEAGEEECKSDSGELSPEKYIATEEKRKSESSEDRGAAAQEGEAKSAINKASGERAEEPRVGETTRRTFMGRVCDSLSSPFRSSSKVHPDSSVRTTTSAPQPLKSKGNKVAPSPK
jgi:Leucine-rich repeat (LRR) protein